MTKRSSTYAIYTGNSARNIKIRGKNVLTYSANVFLIIRKTIENNLIKFASSIIDFTGKKIQAARRDRMLYSLPPKSL